MSSPPQVPPAEPGPLPPPLRVVALFATLLCIVSWLIAWLAWMHGAMEAGGMWPHAGDRFTDLFHYDAIFPLFHQARFFTGSERFAYPGPSALIYLAFLHLGHLRLPCFIALSALLLLAPGIPFARALAKRHLRLAHAIAFTALMVLTSWPLLFLIERGNIEVAVILLTFLGAALFWRDSPWLAAVCWGLAASLKIYPAILLAMYLSRSQWRLFVLGLATFAAALWLSFWYIGPTVSLAAHGTLSGIGGFVETYADHYRRFELGHDHSFLGFIKTPLALRPLHIDSNVSWVSHTYLLLASLATAILWFGPVRRLPRINRYLLLSLAMVALPPVSFDYTLMHLYPGFCLLVLLAVESPYLPRQIPALGKLLACYTLLLSSENFLFLHGLHLNGPIKAVALFVACTLLIRHPLPEPSRPPLTA